MPDRPAQSRPSATGNPESAASGAKAAATAKRDINALAADLAIAQENEGLRLALREQERIVEELTNECRRLEDRLEDRYQDIDALRRELDRGEKARKSTDEQSARLGSDDTTVLLDQPAAKTAETATGASTSPASAKRRQPGFGIGAIAGMALTGAAVAGLWAAGILVLAPGQPPSAIASTPTEPPRTRPQPESGPGDSPANQEPDPDGAQASTGPATGPTDSSATGTPAETPPAEPATSAIELRIPDQPVAGTLTDPLTGGDDSGPELVALRASDFMMGNPIGMADSDARPAHKVSLNDFLISSHEITFADYDRYVRETGARRPRDYGWGRGSRPVIDVSWDEAVAYTDWLSRKTGKQYRLPSEAEWEYAARGGTNSSYWWGIGSPSSRAPCMTCGTRWDAISTAPVGSFPANPFGLFDTAGNVYEWTADCYHHNYTDAPADGSPRTKPDCDARAVRGGSFNSPSGAMRSHARNHFSADSRVDLLGFRVARDAEDGDIQPAPAGTSSDAN